MTIDNSQKHRCDSHSLSISFNAIERKKRERNAFYLLDACFNFNRQALRPKHLGHTTHRKAAVFHVTAGLKVLNVWMDSVVSVRTNTNMLSCLVNQIQLNCTVILPSTVELSELAK